MNNFRNNIRVSLIESKFKSLSTKDEIQSFLTKYNLKATINDNMTITPTGNNFDIEDIDGMSYFPVKIQEAMYIEIRNCSFTSLFNMPSTCGILKTRQVPLKSLEFVPNASVVDVDYSNIKEIDYIGDKTHTLEILHSKLESFNKSFKSTKVEKLRVEHNKLSRFSNLPDTIKELQFDGNKITNFKTVPNNLRYVTWRKNPITSFKNFPEKIESEYTFLSIISFKSVRISDFPDLDFDKMFEHVFRPKGVKGLTIDILTSYFKMVQSQDFTEDKTKVFNTLMEYITKSAKAYSPHDFKLNIIKSNLYADIFGE